jgi:hypothetical protein
MFRTTTVALAVAATFGTSVVSAAAFNVKSIATTTETNRPLHRVMWYGQRPHVSFVQHRRHRHSAARVHARDQVCYLRGRRGDPLLFMRQQASGCF